MAEVPLRVIAMDSVRKAIHESNTYDGDNRISQVLMTSIYNEFLNDFELEKIIEYKGNILTKLSADTTGTEALLWQIQGVLANI